MTVDLRNTVAVVLGNAVAVVLGNTGAVDLGYTAADNFGHTQSDTATVALRTEDSVRLAGLAVAPEHLQDNLYF